MTRFKKIYIETTNICNLSCNFCPKTSRKLGFMGIESFNEIINKIKGYTNHIYLHLMGEPFLNKNLETFLKIAKEADLKVNITTNGTLINRVKDVIINSKAVRQINISLHSFEANDNDIEFNKYINNILDFINESTEKSETICALRLWNIDTEELKANNNLNSQIINLIQDKLNLEINLIEELKEKKRLKLKDKVYLNMAEKFSWPDANLSLISEDVFCHGLRDQIGILLDGTVVPCCLDSEGKIPLGNIFEKSLEQIITSERARNIYDGFSRRRAVEDLCKRCGYAKRNFK
ncbi:MULTISPECIES: radical SAM/SPASM domain-containing protein [Clostridium]|jgi:radical SAM protein with 4Fe4S-binding SPASM domain|uniref:SPASM domain-containing protein n=1 Tax=Clostridium tertium TaxID=1559 RepID=A0A9X3XH16_9CLOT|nr:MULTISPECIES: radical SAM protein [Clostridium]MDU8964527.1 SPASM domain-containing protein [Clostridium sp.]EEH98284.1 radical SAM additional 4Fe4S-binding domain-containing protein [Clostridium sp. 7_2_43FAA]MBU6135829.1 SPASM domain-containing protein [Clostridium tertium]MDB1941556.1 SPASM domain-containing protein [Clostridium tertium]MDC4239220.1 SPASM domain-containing protein [Clostridium tertium]